MYSAFIQIGGVAIVLKWSLLGHQTQWTWPGGPWTKVISCIVYSVPAFLTLQMSIAAEFGSYRT